jgi:hypothetical protein
MKYLLVKTNFRADRSFSYSPRLNLSIALVFRQEHGKATDQPQIEDGLATDEHGCTQIRENLNFKSRSGLGCLASTAPAGTGARYELE